MKIRSVTLFAPLSWPFNAKMLISAGYFLRAARRRLRKAGYEVQSVRLAMPPFMDLLGYPDPMTLEDFVEDIEVQAVAHQIDYVSIGPVIATTPRSLLLPIQYLPDIVARHKRIFSSVLVSTPDGGINLAAIEATANAIYKLGQMTAQGTGNLRFAMLAGVEPRGPFFPGAYHDGEQPLFGLATEAADVAVMALQNATTLEQAEQNLVRGLNYHLEKLQMVVEDLVDDHSLRFAGLDLSLAPYPQHKSSIGRALESLGLEVFGGHGTVFAMAFLTNCIKQVSFPDVGYCSVMLPMLEDNILAQRAAEGAFTVNDLLLYATLYGSGLDTIPIPGDTKPTQIASFLLDIATLSSTLRRPLSASLLPIPGLKAGDRTTFDGADFELQAMSNSVVLPLKKQTAAKVFSRTPFFHLPAAYP